MVLQEFFRGHHGRSHEDRSHGNGNGPSFMMVVSYWEQACALLNYGLLHEDLFFETSGEFFGVWERLKPTMAEGRKMFSNPLFLANVEKAAHRFEAWSEARTPGAIARDAQDGRADARAVRICSQGLSNA